MSKRIRVTVTQEDIDKGEPFSGRACPLARAVKRLGYERAHIARTYWMTDLAELGPDIPLPRSAMRFINRYDTGRPVQPATFLLPLPADVPD